MRRNLTFGVLLALSAAQARADGKMFWREAIPPEIPFQRALIVFDAGTETLLLQSKFATPRTNGNASIGWVVPVPAVPEVASMSADDAEYLFEQFARLSAPLVTRIVFPVLTILLVTSAVLLLLCLATFFVALPAWFELNRSRIANYAALSLLGIFILSITVPLGRSAGRAANVEVVATQSVGIYDVNVLRAAEATAIVGWLNEHGFTFADKDLAAFDAYLAKGWCFVVAVIRPSIGADRLRIVSDGLAAPLILRFPHAHPVYPLALTGTGGFETEILVYLIAPAKVTAPEYLPLRFADKLVAGDQVQLSFDTVPRGILDLTKVRHATLCKFKDRLTPDRMREDIVFGKAEDDAPYREHVFRW